MSCLPGVADGPQNDLFYRPNPIEIFKPFSKQLIFSSKKKKQKVQFYTLVTPLESNRPGYPDYLAPGCGKFKFPNNQSNRP